METQMQLLITTAIILGICAKMEEYKLNLPKDEWKKLKKQYKIGLSNMNEVQRALVAGLRVPKELKATSFMKQKYASMMKADLDEIKQVVEAQLPDSF